MNRTDSPAKQPKPFGINGQREPILSTTPSGDNAASYELGFPPVTMILKSAGGLPPKGQDMNQILYELSALSRWTSTNAINRYDATFSTLIGGYPQDALVLGDDGITVWRSNINNNTNNPNTTEAGWVKVASDISSILKLGTAANRDVVTSMSDVTTGRVPAVGWMGLGNAGYGALPMGVTSQFLIYPTSQPEVPANCAGFQAAYGDTRRAQIVLGTNGNVYSRFSSSSDVIDTTTEWATHYTTINKPTANDVGALPINGNAVSATKLQTARTINGVAFDGTANISISASQVGSYTKSESDARYVQDVRLGGTVFVNPSASGSYASLTAPAGHVLTAILDPDTGRWPMPDSPDYARARPVQKLINGSWITVAQV